ncbi:MAG: MmgE/PrpD family protein, partial [Dermatophilaceae bacterium]
MPADPAASLHGTDGTAETVAGRLAAWGLGLTLEQVPESARRAASRHLLDAIGAGIAAARTHAADPAVSVALGLGGPPEATVWGTGQKVSAPAAALATGTLVHALDFDDTHAGGLVHASAMVLPTALAVGEQVGADGEAVLLASIVGYEVACRLAAVVPNGFHERGLHPTATCGVFASAIVAARLLGLSEAQTVDALGIAGSRAGGLLEFLATGSSTKQLHPGFSGEGGILTARLAAAGASGPASVIEGRHGLYGALLGRQVDVTPITADLGSRWEVERITIKPYPACQLIHVSLDAARAAMAEAGWRPEDAAELDSVQALVHPDGVGIVVEPRATKDRPRTPYEGKFSLPWSLAALLLDGQVGLATYDTDSITRPAVAALATRVEVAVGDSGPVAADATGEVRLCFRDGRVITGRVTGSAGGPDHPLDDAALVAKFRSNCHDHPGVDAFVERLTR